MQHFLDDMVLSIFGKGSVGEIGLADLDDGAAFGDHIISTDGHTVKPLFFRGGDIGKLSACGTLNDVSVMGAKPLLLTCSFIIQAGMPREDLAKIMRSMKASCDEVGAPIVAGDTKVVEDPIGMYISTTGVGTAWEGLDHNAKVLGISRNEGKKFVSDKGLRAGDMILVSGTIGDHGISLMAEREGLPLTGPLSSDVAPVWDVVRRALEVGGVTAMKDPTRGGLSGALNEMASKSGVGILVEETELPISTHTRAAADILGINLLDVANEGKVVMGVAPDLAEDVLHAVRLSTYGKDAQIIGTVQEAKRVFLSTEIGAKRLLDMPDGDPVPRVC